MAVPRSLYFEIKGYIADSVVNRSVEYVRSGVFAVDSIIDQVVEIDPTDSFTLTGTPSNSMTYIKSSIPVDITITNGTGSLLVPAQSLMILNSNITSLLLHNTQTSGGTAAEVHILHA